ncbi:MAG: sigma 54-dependent Fis family transcriptional regulator [Myxococcales bacterium]|nr:sigma 54-dependent Fis family transcriptional regulator [Myxococcales bacterium]
MTASQDAALQTVFVDRRAQKRLLKKTRLRVVEGQDAGKTVDARRERVTIGRSVICDFPLTDASVSSNHCEIVAREDGFLLRDLESTNGVFVRDVRVREAFIAPGMTFRVGQTRVALEDTPGTIDIHLSQRERYFDLVGVSVAMREIFAVLEKVAASDLTVLIRGETGTGKELVARALHRGSSRVAGPLVVQDCSAIPSTLIESTLFGHERGAFTGASDRHRGSFERAGGGTLFLDEIGELDLALQPKLLRVLEGREIKRVGGVQTLPVDVRVIAATNRDLRQMINEGTFREDLYYRLSVVEVELPPLRQRPEDIPLLVRDFLDGLAARRFPDAPNERFDVSDAAMARLVAYPWPGNVRELKNTIERAGALAEGRLLEASDFMPSSQKTPPAPLPGGTAERFVQEDTPFKEAKQRVLDTFEAAYLKALLDKYGGNITRSAEAAGLTRYHLRELAKRYRLHGYEP